MEPMPLKKRHKKTKMEKIIEKIESEIEGLNDQIRIREQFINLLKQENK